MNTNNDLTIEGTTAARCLLAAVQHPDAGAASRAVGADERPLEALILYGLRHLPRLGELLLSCPPGCTFRFGQRDGEADLVAVLSGSVVAELEVKLRSNINQGATDDHQLIRYADGAPEGTHLVLLTRDGRRDKLRGDPDLARWTIKGLSDLADAVKTAAGVLPEGADAAELLTYALLRLDPDNAI